MEEKDKTSRTIEIEEDDSSEVKPAEDSTENSSSETGDDNQVSGENENTESNDLPEEADETEELKKKLSEAETKINELNDKYVRSHAELENFKRRTRNEVNDFKKYAVEAIVKQLLPVFDNLERAVLSAESSGESDSCQITQGIKMTLSEIERVFEQFSIKPVDANGEKFNPALHMAVGQEERDDVEENIVVNQFQKGYLLHDRLIRPAMVIVSKAKSKEQTEEKSEEENNDIQE